MIQVKIRTLLLLFQGGGGSQVGGFECRLCSMMLFIIVDIGDRSRPGVVQFVQISLNGCIAMFVAPNCNRKKGNFLSLDKNVPFFFEKLRFLLDET